MKKVTVIIISSFSLFLLVSFSQGIRKSAGAPNSHTGGMGEPTCAKVGCHNTYELNSGTGSLSVKFGLDEVKVISGNTYPIEVKVEYDSLVKFGFQTMIVDAQTGLSIGSFELNNALDAQITATDDGEQFPGRTYITHTFEGAESDIEGSKIWTFSWIAPDDLPNDLRLYTTAIAADNDLEMFNDYVYQDSLLLGTWSTGIEDDIDESITVRYFDKSFFIDGWNDSYQLNVYDLKGRLILVFDGEEDTKQLDQGIFLYKLLDKNNQVIKKGKFLSHD